jgi:schlafen family protein
MLPKQLSIVAEADLQALVEAQARESRWLEYKRDWTSKDGNLDIGELVADVSSFANATGGDLVYGIRAEDGIPREVVGLKGFTLEKQQLRAEQLLASWVKPRLLGVEYHGVPLKSGDMALVIRVPRSAVGLHMVMFENKNRVYSRNSAGKYAMDIDEITRAIQAKGTRDQKIEAFRSERIRALVSGKVEVPLASRYVTLVHVQPLAELASYSPEAVLTSLLMKLPLLGDISSKGDEITLDSCIIKATNNDGMVYSYAQLFRDGSMEAVRCSVGGERSKMVSPGYEAMVRSWLVEVLPVLRDLGIDVPLQVGVSHANVMGFTMAESPERSMAYLNDLRTIGVPTLVVRSELLDRTDADSVDRLLRSQFNQVWNAFGRARSPNFDASGKWQG